MEKIRIGSIAADHVYDEKSDTISVKFNWSERPTEAWISAMNNALSHNFNVEKKHARAAADGLTMTLKRDTDAVHRYDVAVQAVAVANAAVEKAADEHERFKAKFEKVLADLRSRHEKENAGK